MRAVLLLLCLACGSCTWPASAQEQASAATLLTQIREAIGPAPCTQTAQCKTLAVGAKACGGPEAYMAWSTSHTDATRLNALAARHRALRESENAASQERSNCLAVTDPGAVCQPSQSSASTLAGVCQLRRAGAIDPI
jgi:hypothetical protein